MKRAVYDGDETEGAGAKEVERRDDVEIPAVKEDKRKFSLFPYPHYITQERVGGSYRHCNPGACGGTCA